MVYIFINRNRVRYLMLDFALNVEKITTDNSAGQGSTFITLKYIYIGNGVNISLRRGRGA